MISFVCLVYSYTWVCEYLIKICMCGFFVCVLSKSTHMCCVCGCVWVNICKCKCSRLTSSVVFCHSLPQIFSHCTWSLSFCLDCPAMESPSPTCFCMPCVWFIDTGSHICLFTWMLVVWTQVLMLVQGNNKYFSHWANATMPKSTHLFTKT